MFDNLRPVNCHSVVKSTALHRNDLRPAAVVTGLSDSYLYKQEVSQNYFLYKKKNPNIDVHSPVMVLTLISLSLFLLSVERQEAQSAGVKEQSSSGGETPIVSELGACGDGQSRDLRRNTRETRAPTIGDKH